MRGGYGTCYGECWIAGMDRRQGVGEERYNLRKGNLKVKIWSGGRREWDNSGNEGGDSFYKECCRPLAVGIGREIGNHNPFLANDHSANDPSTIQHDSHPSTASRHLFFPSTAALAPPTPLASRECSTETTIQV